MINNIIQQYNAPTPGWARKVGAGMFLVGQFIAGNAIFAASPVLGTVGMVLTLGSKLMNLLVDDKAS